MFTNVISRLRGQLEKAPRALLSSIISKTLSEYFVIDQDHIESCLLGDARIVLKQTQIRPKHFCIPACSHNSYPIFISIGGKVEEVIFSWRWSLDGLIQDTTLTISGLKEFITIEPLSSPSLDTVEHLPQADSKPRKVRGKNKDGFIQRYMQQIIDNLTLKITDFEFILTVKGGPSIVIVGKGLELATTASASKNSVRPDGSTANLVQKLGICSFHLNVIKGNNAYVDCISNNDGDGGGDNDALSASPRHYPLIESFGYVVSVTRTSGTLSDLHVVGMHKKGEYGNGDQLAENVLDDGIVCHFGHDQLEVLCSFGAILMPSAESAVAEGKVNSHYFTEHENDVCNSSINSFVTDDITSDTCADLDADTMLCDESSDTSFGASFILPVPDLILVLQGQSKPKSIETRFTLSSTTISYTTDGQNLSIEGKGGIQVNDSPLVSIHQGGWKVDLVNQSFVINPGSNTLSEGKDVTVTVTIKESIAQNILSGIESILVREDVSQITTAWTTQDSKKSKILKNSNQESLRPWSFLTNGTILIRLEGGKNNIEWVEASIESPSIEVLKLAEGGLSLTNIDCGGIQLGPSSHGAMTIRIPHLKLSNNGETLLIQDSVDASFESSNAAFELRDFLSRFGSVCKDSKILWQDKELVKSETPSLPFSIKVPAVNFELIDGILINSGQVNIQGNSLYCETICYIDEGGISIKARSINAIIIPESFSVEISIGEIERCEVPNILCLVSPVNNISATMKDGEFMVNTNFVHVNVLYESSNGEGSDEPGQCPNDSHIPIPIKLKLNELKLEKRSSTASESACTIVRLANIDLSMSMLNSVIEFELHNTVGVHLYGSERERIKGSIATSKAKISLNGIYQLLYFSCEGASILSCSFGLLTAHVPLMTLVSDENDTQATDMINIDDTIEIDLGSFAIIEKVKDFVLKIVEPKDDKEKLPETSPSIAIPIQSSDTLANVTSSSFDELPFAIKITKISLTISELKLKLIVQKILALGTEVRSESLYAAIGAQVSTSMLGIQVKILPQQQVHISSIESLFISGTIELSKPLLDVRLLYFEGDHLLQINLPSPICSTMLTPEDKSALQSEVSNPTSRMAIPFSVKAIVSELNIKEAGNDKKKRWLQLRNIETSMIPRKDKSISEVDVSVKLGIVCHDLFQISNLHASALVDTKQTYLLQKLKAVLGPLQITAGYTFKDWSSAFFERVDRSSLSQSFKMPNAEIAAIKLKISYGGIFACCRSKVKLPLFSGDSSTTSDDLSNHYVKYMKGHVPRIVLDTDICGVNVGDIGAREVVNLGVDIGGAIIAVVDENNIKSSVNSRKKSHDVSDDKGYCFGDLIRAKARKLSKAAKSGRGKRDNNTNKL